MVKRDIPAPRVPRKASNAVATTTGIRALAIIIIGARVQTAHGRSTNSVEARFVTFYTGSSFRALFEQDWWAASATSDMSVTTELVSSHD